MRLGQHFLVERRWVNELVSLIDHSVRPLVEIGGGKGELTRASNPDAVIELDASLVQYLREFNVILADARAMPVRARQVLSSLPYYITYEFLEQISLDNYVERAVLVLQKDVVDKLLDYPTYISFLVNLAFDVLPGSVIPPSAFRPKPRVYSQIVVLERRRVVSEGVCEFLKCVSRFRNKALKNAAQMCGKEATSERKVREYAPRQVSELLIAAGFAIS